MPRTKMWASVSLAALLLVACAPAGQPANPDEVRDRYNAYNAAFEVSDVDAIVAFYVDDAVRLPSNGSIIEGMATIRDSMLAFREQNDYVLDESGAPDVLISGDLAVTYSTFDEHWTSNESGEVTRQKGRWLVVWERQSDGSWKIRKEMWTAE